MKKLIVLLLSAVMVLSLCSVAFGQEDNAEKKKTYPIVGSWKLNEVYETKEGEEPVLKKIEEAQSLYGSDINIYTFFEDGTGHDVIFEAGEMFDNSLEWKSTTPDEYVFTEDDGYSMTFVYDEETDTLHRYLEYDGQDAMYGDLDFVYDRAFVGAWKLDTVVEIHVGDAPVEMKKEENQSLYGTDESIFTFKADGKGTDEVKEGPNAYKEEGTWEMTDPDFYVFKEDGTEFAFEYFFLDDALFRDLKDTPDADVYLRFIYVRTEVEEEEEEQPAEQPPQKSEQPASQKTGRSIDLYAPEGGGVVTTVYELISGAWVDIDGVTFTCYSDTEWFDAYGRKWVTGDYFIDHPVGQIFTEYTMYIYAPEGGGLVLEVTLLTDGRWCDPETGVIYENEPGGGYHLYGSDGSVWVTEAYFAENPVGQNFTGNTMYLYAPEGGGLVIEVSELTDGRWFDTSTDISYEQDAYNSYYFYGSDGSTWVTEDYFDDNPVGQIFTGDTMYIYDPEGGGVCILVSLLTDGRWADPETGVTYENEPGGGYHLYGSDGSVWVTEAYFIEFPVGSNGLD